MGCDVSSFNYHSDLTRIAKALERIVEMMEEDRKPMTVSQPTSKPAFHPYPHPALRYTATLTHEGPYGYGSQER